MGNDFVHTAVTVVLCKGRYYFVHFFMRQTFKAAAVVGEAHSLFLHTTPKMSTQTDVFFCQ